MNDTRAETYQSAQKLNRFCEQVDISRSKAYREIQLGRLKVFKIGRGTYVSADAAKRWLNLYLDTNEGAQ